MIRTLRECPVEGAVPLFVNEDWRERFPFVVQGTTGRGTDDFDLGLFRDAPVGSVMERWRRLRESTGMATVIHARQVHGARVMRHDTTPPGLLVGSDADGHVTKTPGILLAISIADCVPIALVAPDVRAVAALHAGWRGVAGGILEAGITALGSFGAAPASMHVHFGPAICGRCYEVGPEVHEALGLRVPNAPTPVDLRAVLAGRAMVAGIPGENVTSSAWCTRCHREQFFSHRAGSGGRQMSVIGIA